LERVILYMPPLMEEEGLQQGHLVNCSLGDVLKRCVGKLSTGKLKDVGYHYTHLEARIC
jgi:hypothetical protein